MGKRFEFGILPGEDTFPRIFLLRDRFRRWKSAQVGNEKDTAKLAPAIALEKIISAYRLLQANFHRSSLTLLRGTGVQWPGSESESTTLPLPIFLECQEE